MNFSPRRAMIAVQNAILWRRIESKAPTLGSFLSRREGINFSVLRGRENDNNNCLLRSRNHCSYEVRAGGFLGITSARSATSFSQNGPRPANSCRGSKWRTRSHSIARGSVGEILTSSISKLDKITKTLYAIALASHRSDCSNPRPVAAKHSTNLGWTNGSNVQFDIRSGTTLPLRFSTSCSINVASSPSALELFTLFDAGHICSTSTQTTAPQSSLPDRRGAWSKSAHVLCLGRWLVTIIVKNAQSHSSSQHWNPLKASKFYSDQ